jgi:hypothetical protein
MSAQGEIEITAGYKDKTQDGLIKTEKQVIKIGDAAADVKKISKDVVKQMLGWGGAAAAVYGVMRGVSSLVKSAFSDIRDMETYQAQLQTITGSLEEAKKYLQWITE